MERAGGRWSGGNDERAMSVRTLSALRHSLPPTPSCPPALLSNLKSPTTTQPHPFVVRTTPGNYQRVTTRLRTSPRRRLQNPCWSLWISKKLVLGRFKLARRDVKGLYNTLLSSFGETLTCAFVVYLFVGSRLGRGREYLSGRGCERVGRRTYVLHNASTYVTHALNHRRRLHRRPMAHPRLLPSSTESPVGGRRAGCSRCELHRMN